MLNTSAHLDNVSDVRHEPVHAHFDEHDERATHVLAHIRVVVSRQEEETLQTKQLTRHYTHHRWDKRAGYIFYLDKQVDM